MTLETCIKNCTRIASAKTEMTDTIVNNLLELENSDQFPPKQIALMMSFIISSFELIIETYPDKSRLIEFAKRQLTSISPKTKKIAIQFIKNYS